MAAARQADMLPASHQRAMLRKGCQAAPHEMPLASRHWCLQAGHGDASCALVAAAVAYYLQQHERKEFALELVVVHQDTLGMDVCHRRRRALRVRGRTVDLCCTLIKGGAARQHPTSKSGSQERCSH